MMYFTALCAAEHHLPVLDPRLEQGHDGYVSWCVHEEDYNAGTEHNEKSIGRFFEKADA